MSQIRASALLTAVALVALIATPHAHADLVLNEVLYDPAGPDEGLEFVELWNPDTVAVSLAGILLEAGTARGRASGPPCTRAPPRIRSGRDARFSFRGPR